MLEGFMTAIQQSVKAELSTHQESVWADLISHQERAETFQEIIRADLNSHQDKFEKFQERVRADIKSVRADIKSENGLLIQKFEQQTQATRKEFKSQLDAEARRVPAWFPKFRKKLKLNC
jgi:hypothetical protein